MGCSSSDRKRLAYDFLVGLERKLDSALPGQKTIKSLIPKILEDWKALPKSPMSIPENAFLYGCALPQIFDHMQTVNGIGAEEARQSVLCEYHACVPQFSSNNAFRRLGFPFKKKIGITASELIGMWAKPLGSPPPNQAFPDLALRNPFPYKIVFDAKYFVANSKEAANKALVDGVYEASFYRGLPFAPSTGAGNPDWDYEFGCLLSYDASDNGYLKLAWDSVKAKRLFWEGGNIFVMIVRGQS